MTHTRLDFYVEDTLDGKIVIRYTGNIPEEGRGPGLRVFNSRQELADYINPPTAKPEIQASDFLKAEAAKAQSYKCTAPPYPSNQANLGQMNINAANQYCGGIQYSMANLAQQQRPVSTADIDKWNKHIDMMEQIKAHEFATAAELNAKEAANPELSKLLQNDPVKYIEKLSALKESKEPKPFITPKVESLIELAVKAGYSNNLSRFIDDVAIMKQAANLQDDGK